MDFNVEQLILCWTGSLAPLQPLACPNLFMGLKRSGESSLADWNND